MRLVELDPKWFAKTRRLGQGISLLCPCCKSKRIAIYFDRPLDEGAPDGNFLWARSGATFEILTLQPSIKVTHKGGGWHGWITEGAMVTHPSSPK